MERIMRGGAGALTGLVLSMWFLSLPAQAEAASLCNPADPNQVRLQISVSGMRSAEGNVQITIYPDQPEHFLDGAYKLARREFPVTLPVTHACFAVAAPGYYAVALFHDANNNHHFDTTMIGLPAEGYGFSNNPKLYLSLPRLSRTRFATRAGDNPVAIQMKYY